MQLLMRAKAKPCAGKSEGRARHRFEPQNIPIKRGTLVHIGDMKGDVV
jgi:hypothetical protein